MAALYVLLSHFNAYHRLLTLQQNRSSKSAESRSYHHDEAPIRASTKPSRLAFPSTCTHRRGDRLSRIYKKTNGYASASFALSTVLVSDDVSFPDFSTMEHKLETNQYSGLDSFLVDAQLVFDNCRAYNAEGTTYHKSANKLEKALKDKLAELKSKQSD